MVEKMKLLRLVEQLFSAVLNLRYGGFVEKTKRHVRVGFRAVNTPTFPARTPLGNP